MVQAIYNERAGALLEQLRANQERNDLIKSDISRTNPISVQVPKANAVDQFGELLGGALDSVKELQNTSKVLKESYERGEDIPLTSVVLATQKASLGFEATLQVRNKLMKAYDDIMNMPV